MDTSSELLTIGLLIACALFAGRAASGLGLPRVAAYLAVGIALSPDLLGERLGLQLGEWVDTLTTAALGMIAYLIGGSITLVQLRRMGSVIVAGTLGQSLGALLLVFLGIWGWLAFRSEPQALPLAWAFSVLAISTAPAATLAIIHQFRTRGVMTDTLLGVVALDDAVGIICFSILLAFASNSSMSGGLQVALTEIGGAIAVGVAAGWALCRISALFGESGLRLPLILSSILIVIGIAQSLELSLLLSSMSLGFFARLFSRASAQRLFKPLYKLEETVFILFFTLAGTLFDFAVLQQHIDLILIYVVTRFIGKVLGASAGARLADAPQIIVRWLGFGLVPQAGVAVGLALVLSQQPAYADIGHIVVNVILGTTLLYEIIGPLATQLALTRAGELRVKREKHRHAGF